jgi:hypothetical protein
MGNSHCCQKQNIENEPQQTTMPFLVNKASNENKPGQFGLPSASNKYSKENVQDFPDLDISYIRKATQREKESSLISDKINSINEDSLNALSNRDKSVKDQTELLQHLPSINSFRKGAERFGELGLRPSKSAFVVPENILVLLEEYKLKLLNYYKFFKQVKDTSETFSCEYRLKFLGTLDNGSINGYGQILLEGSYFYEGEIRDNLPHGFGIFFYSPEVVYYGEYLRGKREGHGILELKSEKM